MLTTGRPKTSDSAFSCRALSGLKNTTTATSYSSQATAISLALPPLTTVLREYGLDITATPPSDTPRR